MNAIQIGRFITFLRYVKYHHQRKQVNIKLHPNFPCTDLHFFLLFTGFIDQGSFLTCIADFSVIAHRTFSFSLHNRIDFSFDLLFDQLFSLLRRTLNNIYRGNDKIVYRKSRKTYPLFLIYISLTLFWQIVIFSEIEWDKVKRTLNSAFTPRKVSYRRQSGVDTFLKSTVGQIL